MLLHEMGFSKTDAQAALSACDGDVEEAAMHLLAFQGQYVEPEPAPGMCNIASGAPLDKWIVLWSTTHHNTSLPDPISCNVVSGAVTRLMSSDLSTIVSTSLFSVCWIET
jgi:hypothetical protein